MTEERYAIFERRALPRYFAVLRPTSGGGPSYQICESDVVECEIHENRYPISIVKNAEIPPAELHSLRCHTYEDNNYPQEIYEFRARNQEQQDVDIRTVKYWYHPNYFFWNEFTIPVLDFNKRFFVTRSFIRHCPPNLSQDKLYDHAELYAGRREERLQEIEVGSGASRIQTLRAKIPGFVIELLIQDQIAKQNTCSITMQPFSSMSLIGIAPCFHIFDFAAISRWVNEHRECPICRSATYSIQSYKRMEN